VRSVAEVSADLGIPLGVVRVLVSDLADEGKIRIRPTVNGAGEPGQELLERVLRGLQTIRR
jgi:nucleoside phosphorylase